MAIKDQCSGCLSYNKANGICQMTGVKPSFDYHSCDDYKKKNSINLDKGGSIPVAQPTMPSPRPTLAPVPSSPQPVQPSANSSTGSRGMFSHLFSFNGRIRRLEYGLTFLAFYLYELPMELISEDDLSAGFAIAWLLLLIPVLWIFYAQGAKRCHDLDNSGWYQLIPFYSLWLIFKKGNSGPNSYGDDPKA